MWKVGIVTRGNVVKAALQIKRTRGNVVRAALQIKHASEKST